MKLSEILNESTIKFQNSFDSKKELINYLIEELSSTGKISDLEKAKEDVFNRESVMSTGVGKGIALPHAKTSNISDNLGGLVVLSEPLDYNSLDDKPINIAFMLLSRSNNVGWHLKMLSRISRLLNNDSIRNQIIESNSPQFAFEIIKKYDDNY